MFFPYIDSNVGFSAFDVSAQGRSRNLWEQYYKVRIQVRSCRLAAVAIRKLLNTQSIKHYIYIYITFSSIFYCIFIQTHC